MRPHALLIACVLISAVCYAAAVQELTPENFDSVVNGSKNVFVQFYAPWCAYCNNMVDDYNFVSDMFSEVNDVVIAKVDADRYTDLKDRFDLKGFPTMKFFPKGSTTPDDYLGSRDAADIISFINNKAGTNVKGSARPSNVVVLTPENFDEVVLDTSKDVLVVFYAPWNGHFHFLAPMYERLASTYKHDSDVVIATFDVDQSDEIPYKYGASGHTSFIFFPKGNKTGIEYNLKSFEEYMDKKTAGTVNEQVDTQGTVDLSLA